MRNARLQSLSVREFQKWISALLLFLVAGVARSNPAGNEFFEKKIRPLLSEHCYSCHSQKSEKVKGGLLLDTKEGWSRGGDSGPALVPGDPEKSLLIRAVRYTDDNLRMPPKDKRLSPQQIADLEEWVRLGAPDPRTGPPVPAVNSASAKNHWAFQPVRRPEIPAVNRERWVRNPIDAFVLSRLERQNMAPSREADRRTWIRRVSFDLTGLPPTPDELNDFLKDTASDAYERVVDRLLASPAYGERWARHWLDVSRYADTKGYVGTEEQRYPYSYTYRDYVIRAFNEDLPYNQFLIEQIAADMLPMKEDNRPLAALGFLTLGRRFINDQDAILDDRIDVICRGTMALTVICARCHDHKYDPIPTRDYYSLYGILRSTQEPEERPLLDRQPPNPEYTNYLAEVQKQKTILETYTRSNEVAVVTKLRKQTGDYLLLARDIGRLTEEAKKEELIRARKLNKGILTRYQQKLTEWKKANDPVFAPWFALEAVPDAEFAAKAPELAKKIAAGDPAIRANPEIAKIFAGESPTNLSQVAERYGKIFEQVSLEWEKLIGEAEKAAVPAGQTRAAPPAALADASREAIRQILYAAGAPANPRPEDFGPLFLFDDTVKAQIETYKKAVIAVDVTHPGAPARAMAIKDAPKPSNAHVFLRGNPATPGPEAPRKFLEILSASHPVACTNGSGRLDFARAIASPDNPLTARVIVNRVWGYLFGAGLVRTPSDFGLRSDPPTHPELLDWLARRFMDDGWSLKKLQRLIVLSNTYRQSSEPSPGFSHVDPENRMLWKQNRRRLDFEAIRDTLLAVSGRLDQKIGGRSVDIVTAPYVPRRTLYAFIDRQDLPNLFRNFDFANPDATSPQRFQTTVAPQALFLLNSPFVGEQAKHLTESPSFRRLDSLERVTYLYRQLFQRNPTSYEMEAAREFLKTEPLDDGTFLEARAWSYGTAEMDEKAGRVAVFKPFEHFTGTMWQGGPTLPAPKTVWAFLTAQGGHPGQTNLPVVRRWTAPCDALLSIEGKLAHLNKDGDGVRGRIISSRAGLLGSWNAFNNGTNTDIPRVAVKKGDTIDFVVDCNATINADGFNWAPILRRLRAGTPALMSLTTWNAQTDFANPAQLPKPLGPWEKYAQVLLLSNEMIYID